MAYRYMMHVFCDECSVPHPAGIVLEEDELLSPDQSVGDIYDGREVPPQTVMMMNNYFRCPNTGSMYTQKDNHQVFVVLMSAPTKAGDVVIWQKPDMSPCMVALVENDGEYPGADWKARWQYMGRAEAEEQARKWVQGTGGPILLWDGGSELRPL